ncbi:MAG: hypothetical protein HY043_13690 [Verrucomicrobia bacterium]|nr:hypothetical protein [Verrucomicrobiota bacterium]
MEKQIAFALAYAAQLIGLIWIPGIAFVAARWNAPIVVCCVLSWIVAALWGFCFCLLFGAWTYLNSPGWMLFPNGPGATLFLMFGWVGGFIGHAAARAKNQTSEPFPGFPPKNNLWRKRLMLGSIPTMGLCLMGIYLIGNQALQRLMHVEVQLIDGSKIVREATRSGSGDRFKITFEHKPISERASATILQVDADIRDLKQPVHVSDGRDRIALWAPQKRLFSSDTLVIRRTDGIWRTFSLNEEFLDRFPPWRVYRTSFKMQSAVRFKVKRVDLAGSAVEVESVAEINSTAKNVKQLRFKLSPSGDDLTLEAVE